MKKKQPEHAEEITETFEKEAVVKNVEEFNIDDLLTDNVLNQQASLFIIGGYETTAANLSVIAYYLATNQDVQAKAREEVELDPILSMTCLIPSINFEGYKKIGRGWLCQRR